MNRHDRGDFDKSSVCSLQMGDRRPGKLRKPKDASKQRHSNRRNLYAALRERCIVFKVGDVVSILQRDCADGRTPQPDFGKRAQGVSPHCHGFVGALVARRPEARCLTLPLLFNKSIGLGTDSGTR